MKIFFVIALLFLVGCESKVGQPVYYQGMDDYQVQKIFVIDGVTMYRFSDEGYSRYFAVKNGETETSFNDRHSNGKTSYYLPQKIETVEGK